MNSSNMNLSTMNGSFVLVNREMMNDINDDYFTHNNDVLDEKVQILDLENKINDLNDKVDHLEKENKYIKDEKEKIEKRYSELLKLCNEILKITPKDGDDDTTLIRNKITQIMYREIRRHTNFPFTPLIGMYSLSNHLLKHSNSLQNILEDKNTKCDNPLEK